MLAHHRGILWISLLVTALFGVFAARLRVDPDLRRLLPDGHEVLVGLEEIERTFGSTGSVNVVVKGSNVEGRHALADAIVAKLTGHPLLRSVDDRLPSDFFSRHALFYLSDAEMGELEQRVDDYTHYEFCSRGGDACVLPPDPEAPEALESFIQRKRGEALTRTGFRDRYEREGIDATIILLHPTEPASSLEFARQVTEQTRDAIAEVYAGTDGAWVGTDVEYNVVGPYANKSDEQQVVRRDMLRGGLIGLAGVVGIIYLLFRSTRAVVVLVVPLACGVVWSLGLTQLVLGRLTLMTSLISTVLMGMGIDAGIHFFSRAKIDRRSHDDAEAIRRAFHSIIIPLFTASGTTIGAFLVMATSEFPAFREFGLISAWGVALCMLAMCTTLPAMLFLVGIKRHEPKPPQHEGAVMRTVLRRPGTLFALTVLLTVLSFQGVRRVDFEYNGRALQSDHTRQTSEADIHLISKVFGKDIHAGILVLDDYATAEATLAKARARHELRVAQGQSVVASLFGAADLMPASTIDLAARKRAIERMHADNEGTFERLEAIAEGREAPEVKPASKPEDDDWDDFGEEAGGGFDRIEAPAPAVPEPVSTAPATVAPDSAEDEKPETTTPPATPATPTKPVDAKPVDAKPAPAKPSDDDKKLSQQEARDLVQMFAAEPFTIDDLPPALLDKVRTKEGSFAIFAYPDFDAADMRKGVEFTNETSSYLDGEGLFVGETTVYAAMFLMLREEAPIVLGMAAVVVTAFVYWQLRAVGLTLLTLLPLCIALWWLLGMMGAADLKFTLFNMPILPAILGIGVDNGIYLADTIRRTRGEPDALAKALQETGGAILAATFTTVAGFAAFMVADSAGLRGIGAVAALGITLAAISALLVLPTLWALGERRRARRR